MTPAAVTNLPHGWLDLSAVKGAALALEQQLEPVAFAIAFLISVLGVLEAFLHASHRPLWPFLTRLSVALALIGGRETLHHWLRLEADGISNVTVSLTFPAQARTAQTQGVTPPNLVRVSGRLDLALLQQVLDAKIYAPQNPSALQQYLDGVARRLFIPYAVYAAGVDASKAAAKPVNAVTHALLATALAVCVFISTGADALQRAVLLLFKWYYPIAVAQLLPTGMRSKAQAFATSYVGVHAWPAGMVFINLIACSMLAAVQPAQADDMPRMLGDLVMMVPVVIFVLIGNVMAPVYAQKLVAHGGVAFQGMVGNLFATSAGVSTSAAAWTAGNLGRSVRGVSRLAGGLTQLALDGPTSLSPAPSSGHGGAGQGNRNGNTAAGGQASDAGGNRGGRGPLSWVPQSRGQAANLALRGAGAVASLPFSAAEAAANRLGSLTGALGDATRQAGDDGNTNAAVDMSSTLAPPKISTSSSVRARRYLW